MSNEIKINFAVSDDGASDEIAGLGEAAQKSERVIVNSMGTTEAAFDTAVRGASKFGEALDTAQGFTGQLADGVDGFGQAIEATSDLMSHNARKAEDLARAQQDVEQAAQDAAQAQEDYNQAQRDAAQSEIDSEQAAVDLRQALLDKATAQKDYNEAVAEFGANSDEAKQALIDMQQADVDLTQAEEDKKQAFRDSQQAALDGKQALIDQKGAATDLSAANRELASQSGILSDMSNWAGMLSGILGGLTGIIGTVTAVQWAWNAAMTANPVGAIIVVVTALVAVIIYLATKTQFFQTIWKAIWSKIGDPVKSAWKWIKDTTSGLINWIQAVWKQVPRAVGAVFKNLATIITAPYRAAFNGIAWAWNNTIGRLHFSIPSWVPGIGGFSFSVPKIPSLAIGTDEVLKTGLALIHKGERIVPAAKAKDGGFRGLPANGATTYPEVSVKLGITFESVFTDSRIMALIIEGIRSYVKSQGGGNVQVALGRGKAVAA